MPDLPPAGDLADEALLAQHGGALLNLARRSIAHRLEFGSSLEIDAAGFPEALRQPRAVFVTLSETGELRGCVGTPEAWRPLVVDVGANAAAAAIADPRFAPLSLAELARTSIELALLGPLERLAPQSEDELVAALEPGRHGVVLRADTKQALFLPKVWRLLPEPRDFLARLREKAGLAPDHWSNALEIHRFTTRAIGEPGTA